MLLLSVAVVVAFAAGSMMDFEMLASAEIVASTCLVVRMRSPA